MPSSLRLDRIQTIPKEVEFAGSSGLNFSIAPTAALQDAVWHIISCIKTGTPLPDRYYRNSTNEDQLLADVGIMHLHPLGPNTSEILYLMQYSKSVFLLKVGSHTELEDEPRGSILLGLYGSKIADKEAEMIAKEKAEQERKAAFKGTAKGGLLPRRPR